MLTTDERVVLLDESGRAIGTTAKAGVHHQRTPLHLAFSTYIVDEGGTVLMTRRARTKPTWPGVLTNSCCGHPLPDEPMPEAVRRRVATELGLRAHTIDLVLPGFRYLARMPDGTTENEMCPVYRVLADGDPDPDPDEVGWIGPMSWQELAGGAADGTLDVSPWCREQVVALTALGPDPLRWPVAEPALLPAAARPRESS